MAGFVTRQVNVCLKLERVSKPYIIVPCTLHAGCEALFSLQARHKQYGPSRPYKQHMTITRASHNHDMQWGPFRPRDITDRMKAVHHSTGACLISELPGPLHSQRNG